MQRANKPIRTFVCIGLFLCYEKCENALFIVTLELVHINALKGFKRVLCGKTSNRVDEYVNKVYYGTDTYVYLYYTRDNKELYYADYEEATDVNASMYANMSVSVAKWSTDGLSDFHSKHIINGTENNRYVDTKTITVSVADFGD